MQTQIFEQTTVITSTAVEVFNSETYQGGILNVASGVFLGIAIANTGSSAAQFQLDVKTHPNGEWVTHTAMNGSFDVSTPSFFSNSLYRQSVNISSGSGSVAANSFAWFSANLKFVYGIRILSRMATGSSGNSIRIRGNVKVPIITDYNELEKQDMVGGSISGASIPTFTDVSDYSFASFHFVFSGTGLFQNFTTSTLVGTFTQSSPGTGYVIAVRYYPGDVYFLQYVVNNAGAILGSSRTSFIIEASELTSTVRNVIVRTATGSAYEIGFLWNISSVPTVDYYVSLNG